MNKQGGLPAAARYLARAVALPPSNTSWYMGLSNGAAGLCECLSSAIIYVYWVSQDIWLVVPLSSLNRQSGAGRGLDVNVQYRISHVLWVSLQIQRLCPRWIRLQGEPETGATQQRLGHWQIMTQDCNACLACAGDLQAILVSNPRVAAAVAEICMVGLATTVQATKGPPKPDKARIDRLSYVVSEHTTYSLLATLHLAVMQELRLTAHCKSSTCILHSQSTSNMVKRFAWRNSLKGVLPHH
jgi:hypothetical protein